MKRSLALAAVIPAFFSAGCSAESNASPQCSDVWVDGKNLPGDYDGCLRGDSFVVAPIWDCVDGTQATGFRDRFYAVLGGTIYEGNGKKSFDPAYVRVFAPCLGAT